MSATIRPELEAILMRLVEAWDTGERKGQKVDFMWSQTMGGDPRARITHPGLAGVEEARIAVPDLRELEDAGLVALTDTRRGGGQLRLTGDGLAYANRIRQRTRRAPGGLAWKEDVRPVLGAVYAATSATGSAFGVDQAAVNEELGRDPKDATTDRVLHELERSGYLEASVSATGDMLGANVVRLTEKGLQQVAGWPSQDSLGMADRLLWVLEERIEQAPTEDERTRLQRLRDAAVGIGRDVLTDVLSKMATEGL